MIFPEDDEMSPEEAQEELHNNGRMMAEMQERESYLRRRAREKTLDPKDAKLVELAHAAGHGVATEEALKNRISLLERRIAVRDEELERTSDRDTWKERAEKAEATLTRSRAARKRR
jgi:hypothetical protein